MSQVGFFCAESDQSLQDLAGIRTGPRIEIFFHPNSRAEAVPSCVATRERAPQQGWRDTYPLTYSLPKALPAPMSLFATFAIKGFATFFQKRSSSSGSGVRRGDDSQLCLGAVVFSQLCKPYIISWLSWVTSCSHMKPLHLPRFMFCLPNPSLSVGAESN